MSLIFDGFTIIICTFILLNSLCRIFNGEGINVKAINVVYFYFYFLFIVPIILDYLVGGIVYDWRYFPKFNISDNNEYTRIIYDIYITFCSFVFVFFGNKKINLNKYKKIKTIKVKLKYKKFFQKILILSIVTLPVLLVLISPISLNVLFTYGWRQMPEYSHIRNQFGFFIYLLDRITFLAIFMSFVWFSMDEKTYKNKFWSLIFILFNAFLNSKRAVMAIIITGLFIFFVLRNISRKKKIMIFLILFFVGLFLFVFSFYVLVDKRGVTFSNLNEIYASFKVDYFRDAVTRLTIYSYLDLQTQVLNYSGESFINSIFSMIPLCFMGFERLGYDTYFTANLLDIPTWAVTWKSTTSILEETICNFGILGFILGPSIVVFLSKIADKSSSCIKVITIVLITLLLTLPLNYIMWIFQLWIILIILDRKTDLFRIDNKVVSMRTS